MKKAVVFDLDGTLINSLPDIAAAMNRALKLQGLPPHPTEAYKRFTGDGARNLSLRALGEKHQHLADRVLQEYGAYYALNSRVSSGPYPGVPEALETLTASGMQVCVLSNKDDGDTLEVVSHYFPQVRFAAVRGRRDGIPLKPDPTALLQVVSGLGLTAADFWYVGDTQTDMRCGANAGMERVAVLWGFQSREELTRQQPEHFAEDAKQLLDILLERQR